MNRDYIFNFSSLYQRLASKCARNTCEERNLWSRELKYSCSSVLIKGLAWRGVQPASFVSKKCVLWKLLFNMWPTMEQEMICGCKSANLKKNFSNSKNSQLSHSSHHNCYENAPTAPIHRPIMIHLAVKILQQNKHKNDVSIQHSTLV